MLLVQSADHSISLVVHLLVQRLKPVLREELVDEVRTMYQFNIATVRAILCRTEEWSVE